MSAIACVVGARPNMVKMAPILAGLRTACPDVRRILVHTGQHYDEAMSDVFFRQLGLPPPDVHLEVGSGPQGDQTARILSRYEAWLLDAAPRPAATLVVGDVNSTMACALASVKLGIPVIHVEAGLRSFDRTMPEEINRIVTDAVSDLLLASEPAGLANLAREGQPSEKIKIVGNVMIDVLRAHLDHARSLDQPSKFGLRPGAFAIWTMHRAGNVDDPQALAMICDSMIRIATKIDAVFAVHPRTRNRLESLGLWERLAAAAGVHVTAPLGYLELLSLSSSAKLIVTDSGGLQEEASVLGVPCLVLRTTTERPITVEQGTSTLVGQDTARLETLVAEVLSGTYPHIAPLTYWDGHAGERVGHEVAQMLSEGAAARRPS